MDDDHSSRSVIADGLGRPTRKLGRAIRERRRVTGGAGASLFGLAPCGVLPATRVTTGAVRSYRTFSPLPTFALRATVGKPCRGLPSEAAKRRRRAVCFLCHCPSGCPDRALPGALPCGVRTFLPPSRFALRWASASPDRPQPCGKPAEGLPSETREAGEGGRSSGSLRPLILHRAATRRCPVRFGTVPAFYRDYCAASRSLRRSSRCSSRSRAACRRGTRARRFP